MTAVAPRCTARLAWQNEEERVGTLDLLPFQSWPWKPDLYVNVESYSHQLMWLWAKLLIFLSLDFPICTKRGNATYLRVLLRTR